MRVSSCVDKLLAEVERAAEILLIVHGVSGSVPNLKSCVLIMCGDFPLLFMK